ncbi:B3/4 domain-containing protein [Serinicoccus marinus]|uniref:B3/B4 domain-containing protein n=1 Tax=Serinicoccus marinus TaxID=247333 RepID=UPI0003B7A4B8|nr:phenylalanine--tRNA ligase beta subunit-related protein [Serinicoccus marinus]
MGGHDLEGFLAGAEIEAEVRRLRPDYRALLVVVAGIVPAPADEHSEARLRRAEAAASEAMADADLLDLPHVAAWREAYRAFGAKPQRTRPSLEALLRRVEGGLPRVNRLTDLYNAVSVQHQIPLGGEDLDRYAGPPRLVRAAGDEHFETLASGEAAVEHPLPGEVVWRDDEGVTCRRWKWRQTRRTALTDDTTAALFILDALEPVSDDALMAAGEDLVTELARLGPDVRSAQRLLR